VALSVALAVEVSTDDDATVLDEQPTDKGAVIVSTDNDATVLDEQPTDNLSVNKIYHSLRYVLFHS
jgi:hypothetical protein